MTRPAGAPGVSPRLLIVLALVVGTAVGVAAFSPVRENPQLPVMASNPEDAASVKNKAAVENTTSEPDTDIGSAPGTAGMQVAIDPETGELGMPTAAQRRELAPDLERDLSYSDEGLSVEDRADGSRHVNLEGRFQSYSVARLRDDGSVEMQCVQGEGEAHRLLHECPSPQALEEK